MRRPLICGLLLVVCGAFLDAGAQESQTRLCPVHKGWLGQIQQVDPLAHWDKDFLVAVTHQARQRIHGPSTPAVVLYDKNGKAVREGKIWLPDAAWLRVSHAAVTREGHIVATGMALTSDGKYTRFIAQTDLAGNTTQVMRTGAFAPGMVCAASDGTVWAIGDEIEGGRRSAEVMLLWHYSLTAGLLHQELPARSFATRLSLATGGGRQGSFLRCAGGKVGLYVNLTDEYIQIDSPGSPPTRWQVDSSILDTTKLTGLALTDSGRVFGSTGDL